MICQDIMVLHKLRRRHYKEEICIEDAFARVVARHCENVE